MKDLTIPIYFKDSSCETDELIGRDRPLHDHATTQMTFFNPSMLSVVDFGDEEKPYSTIFFSGRQFSCPLPIDELKAVIRKAIKGSLPSAGSGMSREWNG